MDQSADKYLPRYWNFGTKRRPMFLKSEKIKTIQLSRKTKKCKCTISVSLG